MTAKIIESPVIIGEHAMVGVVTHAHGIKRSYPGVVALNGGILPRWGRARLYVTLSRKLAALGFRLLRFDLTGIGDSLSRQDGLPPARASVADVTEVLDWFDKDGRVVLVGLCDGANLAAYTASLDDRVVGAILIDPLIPRTPRYRLLHLWRRLTAILTWREIISGEHPVWRLLGAKTKAVFTAAPTLPQVNPNDPKTRALLAEVYTRLAAKNLPVLALFTDGMQHRHCYREQIFEAFPEIAFQPAFQVDYFRANDHHLEWPPHKAWLMERVTDWLATTFEDGPATSEAGLSAPVDAPG